MPISFHLVSLTFLANGLTVFFFSVFTALGGMVANSRRTTVAPSPRLTESLLILVKPLTLSAIPGTIVSVSLLADLGLARELATNLRAWRPLSLTLEASLSKRD